MSIRNMRTGDTIIGTDGTFYTVDEKDGGEATATDWRGNEKTFTEAELECMDADDGIWQQMYDDDP